MCPFQMSQKYHRNTVTFVKMKHLTWSMSYGNGKVHLEEDETLDTRYILYFLRHCGYFVVHRKLPLDKNLWELLKEL